MTTRGGLRVHVAFVGWNFKRVTEPILRHYPADRVYLVTGGSDDAAKQYFERVERELKDYGAKPEGTSPRPRLELRKRDCNPWDMGALLRAYQKIIAAEQAEGNTVFFNLSTGTKTAAMAGLMTAMARGAEAYYANISYTSSKEGEIAIEAVTDITEMPVFHMPGLEPHDLAILDEIVKQSKPGLEGASQQQVMDNLEAWGVDLRGGKGSTAAYNQLKGWLLDLEKRKYIEIVGAYKKTRLKLKPSGAQAAELFVKPLADERRSTPPK